MSRCSWFLTLALVVTVVFGFIHHRNVTSERDSLRIQFSERNQYDQWICEMIESATKDHDFLASHTHEEIRFWRRLAFLSAESPDSWALIERQNCQNYSTVPVIVNFKSKSTSTVGFTVVIGKVIHRYGGGKEFMPSLVFYEGHQSGALIRLTKLDGTPGMLITNGKIRSDSQIPWQTHAREFREQFRSLGL